MKTKIKILIISCVMAAAAVTGFNMVQNSNNMDVSLADIALMAKADGESGIHCYWMQIGHCPDYSCVIVRCFQSIYPDPSYPPCTCGSSDETWYL